MNESETHRIHWTPIQAFPDDQIPSNGGLAALDALRAEWQRFLQQLSEAERTAIRQRSLRRLAIETGILESLYEVDWGLTLTLIAEGFTKDAVERTGGRLDDRTRATLEAQREGLQMVVDFVSDDRPLSPGFIRELHASITRTQRTYEALDALGRPTEVLLEHGTWKKAPNHVLLSDGRLLEYAPPEHVPAEIERLVDLYRAMETKRVHPIVIAAWLHHRFVQIHPFADGNGRVARALVLLVLQAHHYAPLVVDRFHRTAYLDALDRANEGSLRDLIQLFVRLESTALAGELERPRPDERPGVSLDVARTLAAQLRAARERQAQTVQTKLRPRALMVGEMIRHWFETKRDEIRKTFKEQGVLDAKVDTDFQIGHDHTRHYWFRRQIIDAARRAGHYADFTTDSGWCGLRLIVGGYVVRYVAALHGAGEGTGVIAVVTFGELEERREGDVDEGQGTDASVASRMPIATGADTFRVVHSEQTAAINSRLPELEALLDEGLSVTLAEFFRVIH